jgi:hypothetical protein
LGAYTQYSATAASNNSSPPVGAPENMSPSAVNDAMRETMATIRSLGDLTHATLALAVTGATTLSATQAANLAYNLTGTIAAAAAITWPAGSIGLFTVCNGTTGGFPITCGLATGNTVAVAPGETIPIWSDGTNFTKVAPKQGTVLGYFTGLLFATDGVDGGQLVGVDPAGNLIDTAGSTTSGLQELITWAYDHGWDLEIKGGTIIAPEWNLNCTTTVNIPAQQGRLMRWGMFNINFPADMGSADGVVFDSQEGCVFYWPGQIIYQGSGSALRFMPANPTPLDAVTTITSSRFFIGQVCCQGAGTPTAVVRFTPGSVGATCNSTFQIMEVNGRGQNTNPIATHGVLIDESSEGFIDNIVETPFIHDFNEVGLLVSPGTIHPDKCRGNLFRYGIHPNATVAPSLSEALTIYGSNNIFVGPIEPDFMGWPTAVGIHLKSTAAANLVIPSILNVAGTAIVDESTSHDNIAQPPTACPVATSWTSGSGSYTSIPPATLWLRYTIAGGSGTSTFGNGGSVNLSASAGQTLTGIVPNPPQSGLTYSVGSGGSITIEAHFR